MNVIEYPQAIRKKCYFTQLCMISQILFYQLTKCLPSHFHVDQFKINEEQDICNINIQFQCKKAVYFEKQIQQTSIEYNFKITILQIQTSIKFHAIYYQDQFINQENYQMHQNEQVRKPKESYKYIDEFWINFKNYLPKKIYQSYRMQDLVAQANIQKFQKLIFIFVERIIKQILNFVRSIQKSISTNQDKIIEQSKQIMKQNTNSLLLKVVASNYVKIWIYINPKQYKNLCICNRQIYLCLNSQQNYKIIFQFKWGRTGFGLQQKNWLKMYKNKIIELQSQKKKKPLSYPYFYY